MFKQHHDSACASVKDEKRQRSFFSVLFYLNDDFEGGETEFYASSVYRSESVYNLFAKLLLVGGVTKIC